MQYMMAMDQGTTSCRCILFDHEGRMVTSAQKEIHQIYPQPGWVEQDANEIWQCQLAVAREAMATAGVLAENIAGIGITNQRETAVVWDKYTGQPIYHAIVWQCRRTAGYVNQLIRYGYGDRIREKTGLLPDSYFSATKIRWILNNVDGARERAQRGELLFGTIDTWLIWNLTGGKVHVTDVTNASRTMLYNIHTLDWDEELMHLLNIPENILPEVRPSSCVYGQCTPEIFGCAVPISGAAGDQQAALFGQCCFEPGSVKNTYGTGCFLLMNTGERAVLSENGLLTTIAVGIDGHVEYALEGSVFIGGAVIQWLRDEVRLLESSGDSERMARETKDSGGVYLVPAFTGYGAPYWNANARGCMFGLTRGTNSRQIVRSALEAIAYQSVDLCKAMEQDSGIKLEKLKVDGGATKNDFLMQFQSDIMNIEVCRPECVETTALGAAYLAGLAVGYWKNREDIAANRGNGQVFAPGMDETQQKILLNGWHIAVKCALQWGDMQK